MRVKLEIEGVMMKVSGYAQEVVCEMDNKEKF